VLETELAKVQEVESKLRLEFDQRLTKEKEILVSKYNAEVDELCTSQGIKIENHDAKISELEGSTTRRMKPNSAFGVREIASSTLVSKDWSMLFVVRFPLRFRSFTPLPLSFAALVEAFPDSDKAVVAAMEEYWAEHDIVRHKDSKAELFSEELMASTKGRLQPVAKLGSELCDAIAFVFQALWPGQAVPNDVETLLRWIPLVSNRVDV
jgi:hypothetical protein